MRVFWDTNVLVAALISHGACEELYEYCLSEHRICISDDVIKELTNVLTRKIRFTPNSIEQAILLIQGNAEIIKNAPLTVSLCRDPKDDMILSAAVHSKVDCLISGDNDMLVLKQIKGIPIIKPSEFWKFEKEILSG